MSSTPQDKSHRRYNALTGQYVLCSPHRALRPWQGSVEPSEDEKKPQYDKKCYLCPGNSRVNGDKTNPQYKEVFIFNNDFPALTMEKENTKDEGNHLFKYENVKGNSHVICYTPKHDKTMATLEVKEIFNIVKAWKDLYISYIDTDMKYLQIFENKGAAMGCSNPHPHGQAWAADFIPEQPNIEFDNMSKYRETNNNKCMLCNLVSLEIENKVRILDQNDNFVSIVPYWATWPFEVLLLSKKHVRNLKEMDNKIMSDLANILKLITVRYDNLFQCEFPYSMGLHQSPLSEQDPSYDVSHFHVHFYPPLLRSSKIKKWMVGFEMLGEAQRDITPEQAAQKLKELPIIHYKNNIPGSKL